MPAAGKRRSLRHMNLQSVLFKDVYSLVAHLDRKYPHSGQMLLNFYDASN